MTEEGRPTTGSDAVPRVASFHHPASPGPDRASRAARPRPRQIRRVHNPRMAGLFDSPVRNIIAVIAYTLLVMAIATGAYMRVGWSFRDAIYMVVVTVYTVGYNEVRPINTPALNVITIGLIVFGCTGIIFLTGALVQLITQSQINRTIGLKRMNSQIDDLKDHVIVCGFGRLGAVLARSLRASSAGFVLIEEGEARAAEARAQGYLCIHGDASSETVLQAAGVMRAAALATVLSNDAVNVFITLSARALNQNLSIVARGERASTESKLLQAGADKVVLPTQIGAERIAEVILHEESARFIEGLERSQGFQRTLHNFGIELEMVTAAPQSAAVRMTVAALERQAKGAFFIVQINRPDGDVFTAPPDTTIINEGDGVVLIGRPNRAALLTSLFESRVRGTRG
ncbi:NAD-binding protein [Bradyrhizobium sp. LTSP885]|uniref:potassium channel family protein n=2 Tax=unclassified Bradyrhizobium TaxID=2631580 RepID=UPI000B183E26|nr:NAD-binding protein [Bradyrhizobium sp. LTSP885]